VAVEILDMDQYSAAWLSVRLGLPTASCFSQVVAKGEGKVRRTYMLKLLGERLTGEPADNYISVDMKRGRVMEDEARNVYALLTDAEPIPVGFIRNCGTHGEAGCSPDSLIDNDGLLEIKTTLAHIQCDVLLADRLPPEHVAQVQGQLWIAEREWVDFVSYWPKMPPFIKRIYRDENYIRTLAEQVRRFNDELADLHRRLAAERSA
jgi:hypothetical protein